MVPWSKNLYVLEHSLAPEVLVDGDSRSVYPKILLSDLMATTDPFGYFDYKNKQAIDVSTSKYTFLYIKKSNICKPCCLLAL